MADRRLSPRTSIERGPDGEEPIRLDPRDPESLSEGAGDTASSGIDSNVGGAFASAGQDSGGTVGVRRGLAVGRHGAGYDDAPRGETDSDVRLPERSPEEAVETPPWRDVSHPEE